MRKETTNNFGAIIAATRKAQRLSYADLARSAKVSRCALYFWEHGFWSLSDKQIFNLMHVLGLSFTDTFALYIIDPVNKTSSLSVDNIVEDAILHFSSLRKKGILKCYGVGIAILFLFITSLISLTFVFQTTPYHQVFSPRITSGYVEAGDVSAWQNQFPQHSAYELGFNASSKPVFKKPYAALKQVQMQCSDAISALKSQFNLCPFSQRSVFTYITYSWQLTQGDKNALAQAKLLSSFGDVYENSFQ